MGLNGISGNLSKLVGGLIQLPLERERARNRRNRELSGAIAEMPDFMVAYVLRGELNLERGEYQRAKTDFETAVELAAKADDTKSWVVVEQVMRDRALYGLKLAERKL